MDWFGMTAEALREWARSQGLPAFRGQQLFDGLHRHAAVDFSAIRGWPQALAETWSAREPITTISQEARQESRDGTVKTLLGLDDGERVECVSIPTAERHTVCLSSQVGCTIGCSFCASGQQGCRRNLSAGEMVLQVLHHHRRRAVSHIVFMGSGEPLFNYEAVIQAIAVLTEPRGLGLGRRRITLSTAGVPDGIRRLAADEPQITLAISLHACDDATRDRLVPLNRRWPLASLFAALDVYRAGVNRRLTFEFVLLEDANMDDTQAQALGTLGRRYGAHINLIPFNPSPGLPHRRPGYEAIARFTAALEAAGGHYTLRGQRGGDIAAACGQLARKR